MKKLPMLGIATLLIFGIVATGTLAFKMGGRDENIQNAFEEQDYEGYLDAFEQRNPLSEEEFNSFADRHQQRANKGQMNEFREQRMQAIENADYEAWVEAIESLDRAPMIAENIMSEEDFDLLVELHNARQEGDLETVRELQDQLGIEGFGPRGMGQHNKGHGCLWEN